VGDAPSLDDIHKRIISEFTPACLVVDSRDDVIHVVGNAGEFLKQPSGPFTRNVFKLTAHNLANALRSALIRAQQKGDRFTYEDVRYKIGRKMVSVKLHVRPLPDKNGKLTGVRLVFLEKTAITVGSAKTRVYRAEKHHAQQIADLERDLSLTRESLQATVQDLETSNEEIQAANEELLAANEELQSTNEELQSVNEELHTVNIENQNRIEELTRLTNDINNLLGAAALGVLLVDAQLRVRRASRSALALLELTETDLGVPIETVARILHAPDLSAMAERVMRTGQAEEREIERAIVRRWLLLRCMPFNNEVGKPDGVVLSIVDLTERHTAEQRLISQAALTQSVLDAMEAHVAILDCDGCIVHVNEKWMGFASAISAPQPERLAVGSNYFDVCDGLHESATAVSTSCLEGMRQVLRGELSTYSCDYGSKGSGERRWFRLHAVPLNRSSQPGLAVAHFEITPIKKAEELIANRLALAGTS
jgi:two-component system, chemotaxis family, CheB/CheR fusion protein